MMNMRRRDFRLVLALMAALVVVPMSVQAQDREQHP